MRKKIILTAAVVAAFAACSATVKAVQIDGVVSIVGNVVYTPNDGILGNATGVPTLGNWNNTYVFSQASGDLWTALGLTFPNPVAMATWSFNPALGKFHFIGLPGGLWYNLNPGGVITLQNNSSLAVDTTGTLIAPGFDPTPAIFNFTSQGPTTPGANGYEYTWSGALGSVNRFQVPDGGTTALMLGSVFLIIGFLRNKLVA